MQPFFFHRRWLCVRHKQFTITRQFGCLEFLHNCVEKFLLELFSDGEMFCNENDPKRFFLFWLASPWLCSGRHSLRWSLLVCVRFSPGTLASSHTPAHYLSNVVSKVQPWIQNGRLFLSLFQWWMLRNSVFMTRQLGLAPAPEAHILQAFQTPSVGCFPNADVK